jgi:hypothetical protein
LSTAITGTGTVTPYWATLAESPVTTTAIINISNTSRTYLTFVLDGITSVVTEALATMSINKAGTVSSAASYTVTAGKTLRIQSMSIGLIVSSGVQNLSVALRAVAAGTVLVTSPILARLVCSNPVSAGSDSAGNDAMSFPDGLELPSGSQIGISHVGTVNSSSDYATVIAYEY